MKDIQLLPKSIVDPSRASNHTAGAHGLSRQRLGLLLSFTAAILAWEASAQTWQTVDDFQYGQSAQGYGLAVTPNGTVLGAGLGDYSLGYRGLVRASTDGGKTWLLLDDFLYPGLNYTVYAGIVADSSGNLYTAGTAYDDGSPSGGAFHWIVRRSVDGGATWSIVDDFVPGGQFTQPNGITVDTTGNVYVAGDADYNTGNNFWTVRKGVGGTNFTTVDSFSGSGFYNTTHAVFVHPAAGVFAVGEAPVAVNRFGGTDLEWTVRRSTNGGVSWSTVDTFALSSSYRAEAFAVGADSLGNLYVVGRAANKSKSAGIFHWLVRKGVKGGTSWTTVDDFQPFQSGIQGATGFAASANGDLYVVGGTGPNSWGGSTHWITRKNTGGTGIWSTVDDFQYSAGAGANGITVNSIGNVFAVGSGSDGSTGHWLVRKY